MNEMYLENEFPEMHGRMTDRLFTEEEFLKNFSTLPLDEREVFDHIRDIKDPEHPMTLEELGVVDINLIEVDDEKNYCSVEFKPTIPHCSMATLIGLSIKVQLVRLLPTHFKVDVRIVPGTHASYSAINKQLDDKERIAAALENVYLLEVLNDCLMLSEPQTLPTFIQSALDKSNNLEHPKIMYIQLSRQHIESYRRWRYVLDCISKNGA